MAVAGGQDTAVNKEDNIKQQQEQLGPQKLGGAQGAIVGAGGGVGTARPTQSGRFVNLQSYLKANKPQDMAEKVVGKTEQEAGKTISNIKQAGQEFGKQVGQFQQGISSAAQQAQEQIKADPSSVSNLQEFQRVRDASYTGPQKLQAEEQLKSGISRLAETGKMAGSEAGRTQLLRQTYAPQANYSRGQAGLDQALLQMNPQNLARLKALQGIAATGQRELNAQQAEAIRGVQGAQQAALQAQQGVRGTLESEAQKMVGTLGERAKEMSSGQQKAFQAAQQRLASGQFTEQDLQNLGIQSGQRTYGLKDFGQFASYGGDLTPEQVAKQEEIAKISALQKLAGQTASQDAQSIYNKFSGLTEGQQVSPYNLNKEQFQAAIQNRQVAMQNDQAAINQDREKVNNPELQKSILNGHLAPEAQQIHQKIWQAVWKATGGKDPNAMSDIDLYNAATRLGFDDNWAKTFRGYKAFASMANAIDDRQNQLNQTYGGTFGSPVLGLPTSGPQPSVR